MKKIITTFIFAAAFFSANACDICGCSGNGYHLGILPQFKKNFIGLRYSYRNFNSQHLISEQLGILGTKSAEYYNTTELWGRFYAGDKLQIFAIVPFNYFTQHEENTDPNTIKGLGDITLAATYILLNKNSGKKNKIQQTLMGGGGVKLPTGKFTPNKTGELNPSLNTGTGSLDFLSNIIYTARYNHFGINMDAGYQINTANKNDFKYGNRVTAGARVFYWQNIGSKLSVLPNIGIINEYAAKDKHYGENQNYSGGSRTNIVAGAELYTGKVSFGASWFHPVKQNLSKGLVTQQSAFTATVTFLF